jgi:hypothetical protein
LRCGELICAKPALKQRLNFEIFRVFSHAVL